MADSKHPKQDSLTADKAAKGDKKQQEEAKEKDSYVHIVDDRVDSNNRYFCFRICGKLFRVGKGHDLVKLKQRIDKNKDIGSYADEFLPDVNQIYTVVNLKTLVDDTLPFPYIMGVLKTIQAPFQTNLSALSVEHLLRWHTLALDIGHEELAEALSNKLLDRLPTDHEHEYTDFDGDDRVPREYKWSEVAYRIKLLDTWYDNYPLYQALLSNVVEALRQCPDVSLRRYSQQPQHKLQIKTALLRTCSHRVAIDLLMGCMW